MGPTLTGNKLLLEGACENSESISQRERERAKFFPLMVTVFRDRIYLPGKLIISWFNWWVSFAPEFQCCYFCESSSLFYLSFNFDFYVSKIMHL